MAWQNKTESYLNSLPVARSTSDAVRVVGSHNRVYAIGKGTNNRIKLWELLADGRFQREVGDVFTVTGNDVKGATWDETIGAIRLLIQRGSNQLLYRVNVATGAASDPISTGSGNLYTGLSKRGTQIITQGAGNNTLFNLTISETSVTATALTGKLSPVAGADQRGIATLSNNNLVFLNRNGALYEYNYTANTNTQVTWPRPGGVTENRYCGVGQFGNNLIVTRVRDTSLGLGNTYLLRNTDYMQTPTDNDWFDTGGVDYPPITKSDDNHVYASWGSTLYSLDPNDGRRTTIGVTNVTGTPIVCLVWGAGTLYALTRTAIWTLNPSTGAGTRLRNLGTAFTASNQPHSGFYLSGSLVVWDRAGTLKEILISTGGVTTGAGSLGANTGGFYEGGKYYFVDTAGNIKTRGPNQSDTVTTLLDPTRSGGEYSPIENMFHTNGKVISYDNEGGRTRPVVYASLFPELYRRGSLLNQLNLRDPGYLELDSGYTATDITLPAATGGKGPYTYQLRHNGSTTLPAGFTLTNFDLSIAAGIATGTYDFEWKVTDSEVPPQSVSQAFRVFVGADVAQPDTGNPPALAGQTINRHTDDSSVSRLNDATGGNPPFTYQLGGTIPTPQTPSTRWSTTHTLVAITGLTDSRRGFYAVPDLEVPDTMWLGAIGSVGRQLYRVVGTTAHLMTVTTDESLAFSLDWDMRDIVGAMTQTGPNTFSGNLGGTDEFDLTVNRTNNTATLTVTQVRPE